MTTDNVLDRLPFVLSLVYAAVMYRQSKRVERAYEQVRSEDWTEAAGVVLLKGEKGSEEEVDDRKVPYDHNGN